jgi:hypothetical protein
MIYTYLKYQGETPLNNQYILLKGYRGKIGPVRVDNSGKEVGRWSG